MAGRDSWTGSCTVRAPARPPAAAAARAGPRATAVRRRMWVVAAPPHLLLILQQADVLVTQRQHLLQDGVPVCWRTREGRG